MPARSTGIPAATPLSLVADDLFTGAAFGHGEFDIPAVAEIFNRT